MSRSSPKLAPVDYKFGATPWSGGRKDSPPDEEGTGRSNTSNLSNLKILQFYDLPALHCVRASPPRQEGNLEPDIRRFCYFGLAMKSNMAAMVLVEPGRALAPVELPVPTPLEGQLLVEVHACAVCRTDLHVIDGDLRHPKLPLIPGHEIVGRVRATGAACKRFSVGDRVGIPWLGWTCGGCEYCLSGQENLCDNARFTGYTIDGGYAEFTTADERYCFPIPESYDDISVAPLLCAGLIGYRSLRKTKEASVLGVYGFGAAAHIVVQIARHEGKAVYAFTRPGDTEAQQFAYSLGAAWAGSSEERPPRQLDAAIIFAPVGALVPAALAVVRKGGVVVCGGIHMSEIPSFPYEYLWGERQVVSVANLTRRDAQDFMSLAAQVPIATHVHTFSLRAANDALDSLRRGRLQGAAVLVK